MISIEKDGITKVVSQGAYDLYFKKIGYTKVEEKAKKTQEEMPKNKKQTNFKKAGEE